MKPTYIECYEDFLKLDTENVENLIIIGLEESVKTIDISNFRNLKNIAILNNYGLEKINGLNTLPKLRSIYYPKHESDAFYNSLLADILNQIKLPILLEKPSAQIVLSILAIPMLKEKYPDFFDAFQAYSNKIFFGDVTQTVLQGDIYSSCTFDEAKEAESIIDKWIIENISSSMNNVEKFARIYEFVIGFDYDSNYNESSQSHSAACSALKMVLGRKGICVGYAQLLVYMCSKCGLKCEYVQACTRGNYNIIFNKENDFLDVKPIQEDVSKLPDLILPNHAIVRFSPDGINWLFSDPTNDSYFARIAREQNKKLKKWCVFCLTQDEMELFNIPYMFDQSGNKLNLNSQLTEEIATQINSIENIIFGQTNPRRFF